MIARDDLGRHTAGPLSVTWLIRQRLPDEGKGIPFGPGFLDSTVGERQPLPWPGV